MHNPTTTDETIDETIDDEPAPTQPVIAWRLRAPSKTGGKVYTIAIIGNTMFTAWGTAHTAGPRGVGSQHKITTYDSSVAAFSAAIWTTSAKEDRGYTIDIAPRQLVVHQRDDLLVIARTVLIAGTPV